MKATVPPGEVLVLHFVGQLMCYLELLLREICLNEKPANP